MSVNPFDIKTVLLAKHAQHVVLIHFPIAVFIVAVAIDYCAHWTNNRPLAAAVYFNLLLAVVFTVPVVATGLIAWQLALEGQKLEGILLMHLVLGCITSVLIWLVFWIHLRVRRHPEEILAKLPPAARSDRGVAGGVDGASRWDSQWRERTRVESVEPSGEWGCELRARDPAKAF
jgi:uncharacterized membrane protein